MTTGHEDNGLLITSMDKFILEDNSHVFTTAIVDNNNKFDILKDVRAISNIEFEYFLPALQMLNNDIKEHLTKNGTYGYIVKYSENFISLIFQSSTSDFINKFANVNEIMKQDNEWRSFLEIQKLQKDNDIDFKIWSKGSVFDINKENINETKLYTNYSSVTMIINIK